MVIEAGEPWMYRTQSPVAASMDVNGDSKDCVVRIRLSEAVAVSSSEAVAVADRLTEVEEEDEDEDEDELHETVVRRLQAKRMAKMIFFDMGQGVMTVDS